MDRPPRRRFTLLDAMILVAATGFGVAGGRVRVASEIFPPAWWGDAAVDGAIWPLVAWSTTLLALQLRGEGRRRLGSRPGAMAGVAVLAALAMAIGGEGQMLLDAWREGKPESAAAKWVFARIGDTVAWQTTYAVAGAWAALAVAGRWRPGRDWVDRAGIALGLSWLGLGTVRWVAMTLPSLFPGLKGH